MTSRSGSPSILWILNVNMYGGVSPAAAAHGADQLEERSEVLEEPSVYFAAPWDRRHGQMPAPEIEACDVDWRLAVDQLQDGYVTLVNLEVSIPPNKSILWTIHTIEEFATTGSAR